MHRAMTWLAAGLLLVVGIGAVLMSTVGLDGTQAATAAYLTQAAQRGDVIVSSAATGTVSPAETYTLAFGQDAQLAATATNTSTQSWRVDEVLVVVGDRVTAGQVLATADTSDLEEQIAETQASLDAARITLREAQTDLAQSQVKARQGVVDAESALTSARLNFRSARQAREDASDDQVLQARMALLSATDQLRNARRQVAEANATLEGDFPAETIAVSQARANALSLESTLADLATELEHADLVAPVDGIISAIAISAGLPAPAGGGITLDSATLQVVADVVESDITSIAVGQPASVSIDALGSQVAGTVSAVAPSTTGTSSSVVAFPVTVTLTDPGDDVRSGMSSDVEITTAEADDVVTVPAVAVNGSGDQATVLVAGTDGSVSTRGVVVGVVSESLVEIQSGISEGEAVVVGTDTARTSTGEDEEEAAGGGAGFGSLGGLGGLSGGAPPQGGFGDRQVRP